LATALDEDFHFWVTGQQPTDHAIVPDCFRLGGGRIAIAVSKCFLLRRRLLRNFVPVVSLSSPLLLHLLAIRESPLRRLTACFHCLGVFAICRYNQRDDREDRQCDDGDANPAVGGLPDGPHDRAGGGEGAFIDGTFHGLDATLLDGTEEEVVSWWDRLAAYYRTVRDDDRMTTGRIGERCSSEYELRRTGFEPKWIALDANDAGYDLISQVEKEDARRLLIEVKTSTLNWEDADAILTRHEWNVLSQAANACLDLWCVAHRPYLFLRVVVQELTAKMPVEPSECQWLTLTLPFRVLGVPVEVIEQSSLGGVR
jgi:hypothetical protein